MAALRKPGCRSTLEILFKRILLHNHRKYSLSSVAPSSDTEPAVIGHPWRIVSAVCVQRFPIISRAKTPLEKKFEDHKVNIKLRRSRLSDYELEERAYLAKKQAREKKAMEEDIDMSKVDAGMEFEELEEARELELQYFRTQPRETEADRTRNYHSLYRKLDSILYLLVKKPRELHSWQMPQGGLNQGESLIQTAQRELLEECGSELSVQFLSNTPVAYFQYRYPEKIDGLIGSKVFFFKAQFISGEVILNKNELEDFVWVTKQEMKDYLSLNYYNVISPALLD